MDKIRAFLSIIYQQRFWVLSVVGVLVAVVCWQISSSSLIKEYASNRSKIDQQFSAMRSLNGQPFYPNPQVIDEDRKQAVKLSGMVKDMWQGLYDKQRQEVLSWPEVLGADFISEVEQRRFGEPIGRIMRERYLNYIKEQFQSLLDIVKAEELQGVGQTGRFRGGEGDFGSEGMLSVDTTSPEPVENDSIVQWLDQSKLRQELQLSSTPSVMRIWVIQEDLWVYETLLNVIAQTNQARGTTRSDNAAIRVIAALEVGREAGFQKNPPTILNPRSSGSGDGEGGMGGEMFREGGMEGGGMDGEMFGREGGGEGGGEGNQDASLLKGRYIDPEGAPMDGDVETLADSPYRRLPVRMELLMEQRWIPQLLVFCANQALPIEVQGLRVNPDLAAAGFSTGGRTGSRRSMRGLDPQASKGMVSVYLRGVVYIYNRPNLEQLAVPGAESEQPDQLAEN